MSKARPHPPNSPNPTAVLARASDLYRQGQLAEAEALCRGTLERQPTAPGFAILGSILFSSGRSKEAISAYNRALALDSNNVMALNNLARILQRTGDLRGAIDMFTKALVIEPDLMVARTQLASALQQAGQLDDAEKQAREAVRRHRDNALPQVILARVLLAGKRADEARAAIEHAVMLDSDNVDVYATKAMIETHLGDSEAAVLSLGEAVRVKNIADLHSAYLITMQYSPSKTEQEIYREHLRWSELYTKDIPRRREWPDVEFQPGRRLRVGFVSGDFRKCSTPFLLLALLENRSRDDWELTCYSNHAGKDDMTSRFRALADHWREVAYLSDAKLAQQVVEDRIDVLIDLNGHTKGNRLLAFAYKPAPVQVAWLDYVATTGLDAMDVLFGDAVHTPFDEQRYFVERLRHLPHDYIRYWAPDYASEIRPLPAATNGFVTFGCFNSAYKISPPEFRAWAEILSRLPESHLILNDRKYGTRATRERFINLFSDHGVASERIEFMNGSSSHGEFLKAYNRIDIALDSFPYSGGLTTCEALYMGVPVVAFPGSRFSARHATCHLKAAGLEDWIATDAETYVDLAVAKARALSDLANLRRGLRQQMAASPLMDGAAFARGFAELLREVWREACAARNA